MKTVQGSRDFGKRRSCEEPLFSSSFDFAFKLICGNLEVYMVMGPSKRFWSANMDTGKVPEKYKTTHGPKTVQGSRDFGKRRLCEEPLCSSSFDFAFKLICGNLEVYMVMGPSKRFWSANMDTGKVPEKYKTTHGPKTVQGSRDFGKRRLCEEPLCSSSFDFAFKLIRGNLEV